MNQSEKSIKKRKVNSDYVLLSKEELLSTIYQLENTIQYMKKTKQSQNVPCLAVKKCKIGRQIDFSKYNKRHIALKILYLGWDYDGFVVQDNSSNTIEHHLFYALLKGRLIEKRVTSNYHRCGRTDQGVSSFSQVVSLTVRSRLNDMLCNENELPYCKILNGLLPKNIRVIAWASVPDDFSARFNCKMRTYKYWFPRGNLNVKEMHEAIQSIIGFHDFRNLCKMDVANGVTNFQRRIHTACVLISSSNHDLSRPEFDMCEVIITGEAFLWHQIRAIVSILFLVGQGKENKGIFKDLLNVNKYPRKPQYAVSSSLPLNLFHCEFENINWIIDQNCLTNIISLLHSNWTYAAVKCSMLESMIKECEQFSNNSIPTDIYRVLFNDVNSKIYKPLLTRPTAQSLEDRISHYVTKGKLELTSNLTHDN